MSHSIPAMIMEEPEIAAPRLKVSKSEGTLTVAKRYIKIVDNMIPISKTGERIGRISEIRPRRMFPRNPPELK